MLHKLHIAPSGNISLVLRAGSSMPVRRSDASEVSRLKNEKRVTNDKRMIREEMRKKGSLCSKNIWMQNFGWSMQSQNAGTTDGRQNFMT